ncbi:thiamine phosphate synthase [Flavobacterium sp. HSC-61S13]|uniref:thiamine phosphate synthase n=1 Tax=Flavobacterium sp. HSC-61S13 TaxID=2910963 RepID=UPI00209F22C3|nr:thiamine phosphate synthase [Flavobacterium sp. HSC-61S13]MCP1996862.1 thiamine-phosphate pyrophosphorylase [Flavobacterium sp. HSC-61S13]
MIVISNPTAVPNEITRINQLFSAGLSCLHLRKPHLDAVQLSQLLAKIGLENHSKIVLHQHFSLTNYFNIHQIHWNTALRSQLDPSDFKSLSLSTSTHSIAEFNSLSSDFKKAFISPIYPSISKANYQVNTNWKLELAKRSNYHTKLIALGGITPLTIQSLLPDTFDDIALLGTIWNTEQGYNNFKICQQFAP